jgi:hydrogenase expression/formation protein HypC
MCLAIPGKVVRIDAESHPKMGVVSFGGVEKGVCLEWLPDVQPGEYVIVHVGFALSKMDEVEAMETLRLIDEVDRQLGAPDEDELSKPASDHV